MRYSGIQPQYFPRLHYFARILNTDVFVSRDDCQFLRKHKYPDGKTGKSYQAHTPIKSPNGEFFLNVPTQHAGFSPIYKTEIAYNFTWVEDHLKTIALNYSKAPNFKEVYSNLEIILNSKPKTIGDLNLLTILWGITYLLNEKLESADSLSLDNINNLLSKQQTFRIKKILKSMDMNATKNLEEFENLSPNEKIVKLITETGANEDYCGGTSIAAYIDHSLFEKNGISIKVQDWKLEPYPQLFQKQCPFVPNLSIIDLLMNAPRDEAIRVLYK
jgi:hypothetical protein